MSNRLDIYQRCIAELYPFNQIELIFFKGELDFKHVSANRNIQWSYELIKEFEPYWDWEVLNSNRALFDKVTLGLLFPDKVTLPKCNCYRMEDFCEYEECLVNTKRLAFDSKLYQRHGNLFVKLDILCGKGLIDQQMLVETLVNNKTSTIEQLVIAKFKDC